MGPSFRRNLRPFRAERTSTLSLRRDHNARLSGCVLALSIVFRLRESIVFNHFALEHGNSRLGQLMAMVQSDRLTEPAMRFADLVKSQVEAAHGPELTNEFRLLKNDRCNRAIWRCCSTLIATAHRQYSSSDVRGVVRSQK